MQSWKRHLYSVAPRANSVGNAPLFKVQCEPSNHRRNCSFELTGGIGPIERSKMKSNSSLSDINRRVLLSGLAMLPALSGLPLFRDRTNPDGRLLGLLE